MDLLKYDKLGYFTEVEIKSSYQDFQEDSMKVDKHSLLKDHDTSCPNRFLYLAPLDVISKEEIPEYAGLMEFSFDKYGEPVFRTKKRPPLIHKESYDIRDLYIKSHFKYDKYMSLELLEERKRIKSNLISEGLAEKKLGKPKAKASKRLKRRKSTITRRKTI